MSVLVLGGKDIIDIKGMLYGLGIQDITHWEEDYYHDGSAQFPESIAYLLLMTDSLEEKTVKKYEELAKEKDIPLVCSRKNVSCVYGGFCKALGKNFICPFD